VVIPVYDDERVAGSPRPWMMWALFAFSILVFLFVATLETDQAELIAVNFGLVPAFLTKAVPLDEATLTIPPWFTFLTYMFLHGSWLHLASNMIFLWIFGDNIEGALGHFRFLLFYLLCGIAGGALQVVMTPASESAIVGASGAIAGVVAAYLMLRPWAYVTVLLFGIVTARIHAFWLLGLWSVLQLVSAFLLQDTQISFWAHVGGLAAGAILVVFLRRPGVALFEPRQPHVVAIPPSVDRSKVGH
jgi:membrane associated rhomboid family serine protease